MPRTPNVLTEIQVFMSECFSACCILFKIIFTSCGGSTREKEARASTRRRTDAGLRSGSPVLRMRADTCLRFDDS